MEAARYAVGASDIPSAGVGAPNIRQRTFFGAVDIGPSSSGLGVTQRERLEGYKYTQGSIGRKETTRPSESTGLFSGLGDTDREPKRGRPGEEGEKTRCAERKMGEQDGQRNGLFDSRTSNDVGGLAEPNGGNTGAEREQSGGKQRQFEENSGSVERLANAASKRRQERGCVENERPREIQRPERFREVVAGYTTTGPLNGPWLNADWLFCRDGKWRPVEAGAFPLAHGVSNRMGLLRGYGNAINPYVAQAYIEAFREVIDA